MACNSIKNFTYDACKPTLGGIKAVYMANYKDNAFVITEGEDKLIDGSVSGFAEGVEFVKYPIRKNTASFTSTLNNSTDGASYVSTELSLVFNRMETAKRIAMQALALGECIVVAEDSNGEMWAMGVDSPVTATAGGAETGTNKSDRNAYTLTLTDESLGFLYALDETAKEQLKTMIAQ